LKNAVLSGFIEDNNFHSIDIFSEVLQDSVLELIDLGKARAASGSGLILSEKARGKIILRPVEISNSPEVIRRLGVIAINTAIEIDICGQVNSTH
jgi:succinyl-CoA:acetate CoA-transferase